MLRNYYMIMRQSWIKKPDFIIDLTNDSFSFWPDHCIHKKAGLFIKSSQLILLTETKDDEVEKVLIA